MGKLIIIRKKYCIGLFFIFLRLPRQVLHCVMKMPYQIFARLCVSCIFLFKSWNLFITVSLY